MIVETSIINDTKVLSKRQPGATEGIGTGTSKTAKTARQSPIRRKPFRGHQLVISLTICIFLFWTPLQIYYTTQAFNDLYEAELERIGMMMLSLQLIVDPIIVAVMVEDIRTAIVRLMCRR